MLMHRVLKRLFVTVSMALLSLLVMLLGGVPLGAAQGKPAPTVGDIVVDRYDCETGGLGFHVPVTDLPHIPDSNGTVGYSVVGHYDQGPDSDLPGQSFNIAPENSPFTGDLALSSTVPPANDVFLPEGSSEPSGRITSIDIFVGVGYGRNDGPTDSSSTTYSVDCGDAAVPTPSEGDEGDEAATDGTTDSAETDGDGADDMAGTDPLLDAGADDTTDPDAAEADSGDTTDTETTNDRRGDAVAELPSTGAGSTANGSASIVLVTLLSGLAVLCSVAAVRIRAMM